MLPSVLPSNLTVNTPLWTLLPVKPHPKCGQQCLSCTMQLLALLQPKELQISSFMGHNVLGSSSIDVDSTQALIPRLLF